MARNANAAEATERVDLALHGVDVGNGREVEVAAPDERRKLGDEVFARLDVAGHRARLDEGGALPVLAEAFVVEGGGLGRERDLGGARIGPQSQVGAEDVARRRALIHQAHEIARQAHEECLRVEAFLEACFRALEEDDEIDVARIVEFVGAVLADGEHHVAGREVRSARPDRRATRPLPRLGETGSGPRPGAQHRRRPTARA